MMFSTVVIAALVAVVFSTNPVTVKPYKDSGIYLFEVKSSSDVAQLKASFDGLGEIRHSFKVVGKQHFIFVAKITDVASLKALTFPAGSDVVQHPVEHFYNTLATTLNDVNLTQWTEEDYKGKLPDQELFFIEENIDLTGVTSMAEYKQGVMEALKDLHKLAIEAEHFGVRYTAVGEWPPKAFAFSSFNAHAIEAIAHRSADDLGGPAAFSLSSLAIVQV